MNNYSNIKKTTWRGAKVRKIIKFLEQYEVILGQSHFPISDLPDELSEEKSKMEIYYYGVNLSIENILSYIKRVFQREEYSKKEFKKKIFSGAKVVLVLEYIDISIENTQKNLDALKNETTSILTIQENRNLFVSFWESQLLTYIKIRKWVLFGITEERKEIPGEEEWFESVIYESDED